MKKNYAQDPALLRLGLMGALLLSGTAWGADLKAGWGVDGCLSCHAAPADVEGYLRMLVEAGMHYVRERQPGDVLVHRDSAYALGVFQRERAAGLHVTTFAELPGRVPTTEEWDQAPEDLFAAYKAAYTLGEKAAGLVDVWELQGEPDTFACKDLPDHMMATQKAVYLGMKDGAAAAGAKQAGAAGMNARIPSSPGVLMGGIATAPGPWAERAGRNGLYEYTDGLNFHFYGHARDFAGTINAQRDLARKFEPGRHLPIWVTECGLDALPAGDPGNARARELQRDFTIETSRTALDEGLAVFMPFIFVHKGDGYAMCEAPGHPYPAWAAYADFTRRHPLPARPAIVPPVAPSRVVLQWQPDYATCLPQKVSGAYWFWSFDEGGPSDAIEGSVAAYNFSATPVCGKLSLQAPAGTRMLVNGTAGGLAKEIEIPAFGKVQLPVKFELSDPDHYLRTFVDARFRQQGSQSRSTLWFALETKPDEEILPRRFTLDAVRPRGHRFTWIWAPQPCHVTSHGGPWIGVNGVTVLNAAGKPNWGSLGDPWQFRVEGSQTDPRFPPMAITRVDGLPQVAGGFLRVRFPEKLGTITAVRVDLVDKHGQRFAISENFGRNRIVPDAREVLLAYRDFNVYPFGRCLRRPDFHPEDVREIQLRFYPSPGADKCAVQLDVIAPQKKVSRENSHSGH